VPKAAAPRPGYTPVMATSHTGQPLNVHIARRLQDEALLRSLLAPGVHLSVGNGETLPPTDTHVLVAGRPTAADLDAAPGLRRLIVPYAGLPAATRDLLLERPHLMVHNLHHNAAAAAEMAVTLLLAAAKAIVPADQALRQGDWSIRYNGGRQLLLAGKRALVVGLGAVGVRIARALSALDLTLRAIRRHPERGAPANLPVSVHGPSDLPLLLPDTSVLVLAVPLTPDTEHLIGARELALLPDSAVLVNIARGDIVCEDALYEALANGRLAAAGLDVWYRYPADVAARRATLPATRPFHELDNVVLSPHRGGAFGRPELEGARMQELARTLNALARGAVPPHRVDVRAGY